MLIKVIRHLLWIGLSLMTVAEESPYDVITPFTFKAPANYVRSCFDGNISNQLWKIKMEFDYWYTMKLIKTENKTEVKTFAHLTWNYTNPTNQSLDGFAVHFGNTEGSNALSSIPPTNICVPGSNHLWVRTTNRTGCEVSNSSCDAETTDDECLCSKDCSLYDMPKKCKHIGNYQMDRFGYFTIPSRVNYLVFPAEFGISYFTIFEPYYMQYWGGFYNYNQLQMTKIQNCPLYVSENNSISWKEATQICCGCCQDAAGPQPAQNTPGGCFKNLNIGVPMNNPRNFSITNIFPDFAENSINMIIQWLLPVDRKDFLTFENDVYINSSHHDFRFPWSGVPLEDLKAYNIGDKYSHLEADCDNITVVYAATLTKLRPMSQVLINIGSKYKEPKQSELGCSPTGLCSLSASPHIPAINVCDPKYHYCDVNANCTAEDPTGAVALNATCTCFPGFQGNGINATATGLLLGEGCIDTDYCSPQLTRCSSSAYCIDFVGETGANCSCLSGYYGDGYINGTGCAHTGMYVLQFALPVVVVVVAAVGLIAWWVQKEKRKAKDIKWSQFVANSALQYTIPPLDGDSDTFFPTFGDKWEIDREDVRMGDVLGRGNYGIVYKGWYNQYENMAMTKKIDDCEIPVAIKTIKEGPNEEHNLAEFLAEIGFMLNVGDHPNVLKVIGCCTTKKPILLITEFLKYGDLLHFLWDAREPTKCLDDPIYHVTEKTLYHMAHQVAEGMEYLTRSRIIHGDLAARNILVGEEVVCKISDFGLANDVYRYGVIKGQSERCVPFKWISPERMMVGKVPITSKSDVWSFGNLMYEMVTLGCMPYPGMSAEELLEKLKSGYRMKQPSTCNDAIWSVMSKCWKWKASSRPSFADLLTLIDKAASNKHGICYVNIAEVVENIDKEEYANELEPNRGRRINSASSDLSENRSYTNKVFCDSDGSLDAKTKTVRFQHPHPVTSDVE